MFLAYGFVVELYVHTVENVKLNLRREIWLDMHNDSKC